MIVGCVLTPGFYMTRCIITPGFLILVVTVLRYLYSYTPGLLILLLQFLVARCFPYCLYWMQSAWAYTPWFLGWSYNLLPWNHIIKWVGIQKNMSEDTVLGKAD